MNKELRWSEWVVCMIITLCAALLFVMPMLSRSTRITRTSLCQSNLKNLGFAFLMYAEEHAGYLPPRSAIPGNWIVEPKSVYPEYVADLRAFICPDSPRGTEDTFRLRSALEHPEEQIGQLHPDCVSSAFYIYLGHSIDHDDLALAFYEAYLTAPNKLLVDMTIHLTMPGYEDYDTRYHYGLAPILWDRIPESPSDFPHGRRGINVLHMHGNVEFIEYDPYNPSGKFPATYISAQTFSRDAPRLSVDCY